jgi:ABC-type transport system involved in multi-copper enzyme maturation permease subunit
MAAKELKEAFQSGRVALAGVVMAALLVLSMFLMYRDFQERLENFDLIRPEPTESVAVLRPNPLSILARGLDDAMGRSFELSVVLISIGTTQQAANELFALVRPPDVLYITQVVFSLLAMLAAFDLFSGEKEGGTLRMLVASGISRGQMLAGKWLGGLLAILLPYAVVAVAGMLALAVLPGLALEAPHWLRALAFFLLGGLYLAFSFTLGLAISAWTKRAASTLVIGLFTWVCLVFVVPNVATLVARQVSRVPPVEELQLLRNQAFEAGMIEAIEEMRAWPPDMPASQRVDFWPNHWKRIVDENEAISDRYRRPLAQLVSTGRWMSRLSPAASYVHAGTALVGTGIDDEAELKAEVLAYWDRIFPRLATNAMNRQEGAVEPYPPFEHHRRSLAEVLAGSAAVDIGWLILATLGLFGLAAFGAARYDVR